LLTRRGNFWLRDWTTNRLFVFMLQARPLLTRALEENNFDSLVDPRLQNNFNSNEVARMVACGAACVRHSARRRPRMSQVIGTTLCVFGGGGFYYSDGYLIMR